MADLTSPMDVVRPPVLLGRLSPDAVADTHVRRDRLLHAVDQAIRGPVTLLTGAAGSGKTVLMASWTADRRSPFPVAWVSVEPADGGADVWMYLLAALRRCGAVPPASALAALVPHQARSGIATFIPCLLNGLAQLPRPVVVVLDDAHLIDDPAAAAGLRFLLAHPIPTLRLVLSARHAPVPVHRLRLGGQVTELDGGDLAFTSDEAGALLAAHGVSVPDGVRDDLVDRTEGWAAGLALSVLALRSGGDAGPSGGRAIGEYLQREFLDGQTPAVRTFLLRTSVLDRVSAPLASAVAGDGTGDAGLLASLARDSTFVIAVDHTWFRYHRLLTDVLRRQLGRDGGEDAADLHLRAALWFATHGDAGSAVRHALAAGDWRYAAKLLVAGGITDLAAAGGATLRAVTMCVPPDGAGREPESAVFAAAGTILRGGADPDATRSAASVPDSVRRYGLLATLNVAEIHAARLACDAPALLAAARRLAVDSAQMAPSSGRARTDQAYALAARGVAEAWTGRWSVAAETLTAGLDAARLAGQTAVEGTCLAQLALVFARQGRLRRATSLAGEALAHEPGAAAGDALVAHLALALVANGRVDLAAARQALAGAAARPAHDWDPVTRSLALVLRARLLASTGDVAGARLLLDPRPGTLPFAPAALRDATVADLLTASGHGGAALAHLAGRGARTDPERALATARALVASGSPRAAAVALLPLLRADPGCVGPSLVVDACVLDAVAAASIGDGGRAAAALARALALADGEGLRRPFVDAGPPVVLLLRDHPGLPAAHPAFVAGLLDVVPSDALRPHVVGSHADAAPPPACGVSPGVGPGTAHPLSERERAVLTYLPTMLTTGEIAEEMFVSVNTVKTHLKSIYRKLGVARRRDAVQRARALAIL